MAALGRFFGKFFGRTVGDAASFAIGGSISRTIDPILQQVENEAWLTAVAAGAVRPLDTGDAAEIVAEDVEKLTWGEHQAAQSGTGSAQFDALVQAVLNAPGVPELLTLWRRGEIADADFVHGLRKARLELRWDKPLESLKTLRLDPAVVASAIQRGIMRDPGFLPVGPPTSGGTVPAFPVSPLDPVAEAEAAGIDRERLFVETALVGNSMGPQEAAHAQFRGIIDGTDYARAIAEGRTRNEWAGPLREVSRQILTAHDWVELHLRGYIDAPAMYAGTALHGMSQEDTDRLFRVLGRPMTAHQITLGLARGAKFNPIPGELPDPYEAAAHESNVKPSYYDLWIAAGKYSYPSLFQLNALVKASAITAATAKDWATKSGLAPEVVTALGTFWEGEQAKSGGGTTAKPKVLTRAEVKAAWRTGGLTDAQAVARLEGEGVTAADAALLLSTWKGQAAADSSPTP